MHFQRFIFSTLAALAAAQEITQDDIPSACTGICTDVVMLAQRCGNTTTLDDDAAELDCMCRAPNAGTLIPACEACVAEYDNDDTDTDDVSVDENDVYDILTRCSFVATGHNITSANSIVQSVASSFASASGSVIASTSGSVVVTTSIPAQTSPVTLATGAAAPAKTGAAGIAVGVGAFGLAMRLF
ncbi:CAP22 protein [Stagonosporopsis vannaccii]|nr:CAP22 protein [Stagonosporopsis vannaccii]